MYIIIIIIIIIIIVIKKKKKKKNNFCTALFFIRNELTALYTFTDLIIMMMYTCTAQSLHAIVACSVRSVG